MQRIKQIKNQIFVITCETSLFNCINSDNHSYLEF